jgi:hypothetical protein
MNSIAAYVVICYAGFFKNPTDKAMTVTKVESTSAKAIFRMGCNIRSFFGASMNHKTGNIQENKTWNAAGGF